ncbi:unnamed protein product [Pleuronectes platessa]|uniref:Uncharacterized protein n=1 Tax=Pleuronectes platessa TaxID=8262 RepID=A0A9N7Y8N1_PLEPL|nr:unnamed protein product [Pleuronectes platessa]
MAARGPMMNHRQPSRERSRKVADAPDAEPPERQSFLEALDGRISLSPPQTTQIVPPGLQMQNESDSSLRTRFWMEFVYRCRGGEETSLKPREDAMFLETTLLFTLSRTSLLQPAPHTQQLPESCRFLTSSLERHLLRDMHSQKPHLLTGAFKSNKQNTSRWEILMGLSTAQPGLTESVLSVLQ